jgi:hypothetical protein
VTAWGCPLRWVACPAISSIDRGLWSKSAPDRAGGSVCEHPGSGVPQGRACTTRTNRWTGSPSWPVPWLPHPTRTPASRSPWTPQSAGDALRSRRDHDQRTRAPGHPRRQRRRSGLPGQQVADRVGRRAVPGSPPGPEDPLQACVGRRWRWPVWAPRVHAELRWT